MERDILEQFILDNREELDTAIPSLKVWANLDKELEQKSTKRVNRWSFFRMAAAVVILLTVGGIAGTFMAPMHQQQEVALLQEIAPEFVEIEKELNQQVEQKVAQLASYNHDDSVQEDLQQLDKTMAELKQELLNAPKGTEVQILNTLVKSYQTKLAILERVLERMETTNQNIKPANDEISI